MTRRRYQLDVFLGALLGVVAAAVVAVNLLIAAGLGYDVGIREVFDESRLLGIAVIALFVAGPVLGGVTMYRAARRRASPLPRRPGG